MKFTPKVLLASCRGKSKNLYQTYYFCSIYFVLTMLEDPKWRFGPKFCWGRKLGIMLKTLLPVVKIVLDDGRGETQYL